MSCFCKKGYKMNRLGTLKDKIQYRIRKSKGNTFLVGDFIDLSGMDQVLRALRALIKENELIRVGKGVYTKARKSVISNEFVLVDNLRDIAMDVLNKQGVKVVQTPEEIAYNTKQTEQVPNSFIIGINKRVSRNISFKNARIKYERVSKKD